MKRYIIFIVLLMLLNSCVTYYYHPSFQNVPTHTKAKGIEVSLISENELLAGYAVNYAVTNHFGISSNGLYSGTNHDDISNYNSRNHTTLGAYYYNSKLMNGFTDTYYIFSTTGAYSFGHINISNNFNVFSNEIHVTPAIAIKSRYFKTGVSLRTNYVAHSVLISGNINNVSNWYNNLYDVGEKPFLFVEPHLFAKAGYAGFMYGVHINRSFNITSNKISYERINIYFTLEYSNNIDNIFKKSNNKKETTFLEF